MEQQINLSNELAWLWQLAKEVHRMAEAKENFDFTVSHSLDYINGDMQVAAARGRLYKRLDDVLDWYRAGESLSKSLAEAV